MRVISFINMKGGVGKTTLATNVAVCLSRREDKKVLVIDMDPQFNATQCFFSGDDYVQHLGDNKDTVENLFKDDLIKSVSTVEGITDNKRKTYKEIIPSKISDNLYILPGNLNLYKIEISAESGKVNRLNNYLKEIDELYHFDYVIIDTPPTPSIWMISSLLASKYFIIPVKPEPLSYTGVDLLFTIINQKQIDLDLSIKCIGIVLTMADESTIVYRNALNWIKSNQRLKKYLFKKCIPQRTELSREQLNKTFMLDLNATDIRQNLIAIVHELKTRIENDENNDKK